MTASMNSEQISQRPCVLFAGITGLTDWTHVTQHVTAACGNRLDMIAGFPFATAYPALVAPVENLSQPLIVGERNSLNASQSHSTDSRVCFERFRVGRIPLSQFTTLIFYVGRVVSFPSPLDEFAIFGIVPSMPLRVGGPPVFFVLSQAFTIGNLILTLIFTLIRRIGFTRFLLGLEDSFAVSGIVLFGLCPEAIATSGFVFQVALMSSFRIGVGHRHVSRYRERQ